MDIQKLLKSFCREILKEELEELNRTVAKYSLTKELLEKYKNKNEELLNELISANQENLLLHYQIEFLENDEELLESYWNNKRRKINKKHKARPLPGKLEAQNVDPRIFFTPYDSTIPKVSGMSNDEKAQKALQKVRNDITYVPEFTQFKMPEFWLFAWETQKLRKGDCEDGAILMANIMLRSGIPYWRIRLNAGDVKSGGHAYVTYLAEKDNQWYILDWCYWPTRKLDTLYKDAEKYFSIWYSWNTKYIFGDARLGRT